MSRRSGVRKTVLTLAACSALSVPLLGASEPEARAARIKQLLQTAQQAGAQRPAEAAAAYRELIELRPGDATLYRGLGISEYLLNRFDKSADALAQAAEIDPLLPGVQLFLGISYYRLNRFRESVAALGKAPERNTSDHTAHYWLGASYRGLRQYPQAIEALSAARERANDDAATLHELARVYAEHSAELIERLLNTAPDSAPARLVEAQDMLDEGVPEVALVRAAEALESDPALRGAHLLRGHILWDGGELRRSLDEYLRELANDPLNQEAHTRAAAYYIANGAPARALGHIDFVASVKPLAPDQLAMRKKAKLDSKGLAPVAWLPEPGLAQAHKDAEVERARQYYRLGKLQQAIDSLLSRPSSAAPLGLLGRAYEAKGDYGAAAKQWRRLHKRDPDNPEALYALGTAYDQLSLETAEELFEKHPDSHLARVLRGEAYEKSVRGQSEFGKALAEYEIALQLAPDAPGVHHALGRILWKMNRFDEAIPHLEQEIARNPHHGSANHLLGKIRLSQGEHAEAKPLLLAAAAALPDSLDARSDLALAFSSLGEHNKAIETYQALVRAQPADARLHALLARAYRAAGRMEEGKQSAEKSRQLKAANHGSIAQEPR